MTYAFRKYSGLVKGLDVKSREKIGELVKTVTTALNKPGNAVTEMDKNRFKLMPKIELKIYLYYKW
jgi:hypothetical protein